MNKHLKTNFFLLLLCTCFVLSCNNEPGNKSSSDTSPSSNSPATSTAAEKEKPAALAGTLDILVAPRSSFTGLPLGTKLVFTHSFGSSNKPQLTGWVLVGNTFPGTTVTTTNGAASSVSFDASTYFSNVVLMPDGFNKIRNALTGDPNLQFVLFVPKKVNTNFIGYDIYVSVASAFTATGLAATADANPSPPKTY